MLPSLIGQSYKKVISWQEINTPKQITYTSIFLYSYMDIETRASYCQRGQGDCLFDGGHILLVGGRKAAIAVFAGQLVEAGIALAATLPVFRLVVPAQPFTVPDQASSFQGVLVALGIAGNPEPVTDQGDVQAAQLQQLVQLIHQFLLDVGHVAVSVAVVLLAVAGFQSVLILAVDFLHGGKITAKVRMMMHRQGAVMLLDYLYAVQSIEITGMGCHGLASLLMKGDQEAGG
jgi:hypothetical protein